MKANGRFVWQNILISKEMVGLYGIQQKHLAIHQLTLYV